MTRTQRQKFRRMLEAQRAELYRGLLRMRPDLAADLRGDTLESARAVGERDFAVRAVSAETARLRQVEAALQELKAGTFGHCASCDREIPLKRLEAVPWSPYCVSCQEHAEQAGREEFQAPYALAS